MKAMKLRVRVGLFFLILLLGVVVAMMAGETTGLALADLSRASVDTINQDAGRDTLFATLDHAGIYRSSDAGYSWQRVSDGPPNEVVKALAVHPANRTTLYAGTVNPDNQGSLWLSEDSGKHWSEIPLDRFVDDQDSQAVVNIIEISQDAPDTLYLGTEGHGLYRLQLDAGQAEVLGGPSMNDLYVSDVEVSTNGHIYAVTTEGLMIVDGSTLHQIDNLPDTPVSVAIDPANPQRIYAGTVAYGVWVSEDGGQSWQAANAGFGWQPGLILRVSAIAVDEDKPQHLAVSTAFGVGSHLVGDGIYESFNGGQHWIKIAEHRDVVDQLVIQGGGVYAATTHGLIRYGNPLPAASLTSSLDFDSLANPTAIQILILAATVALAGWVLLGKAFQISYQSQT